MDPVPMPPSLTNLTLETIPDAILVFGDDGRIVDANTAAARLTGYSLDELRSTPVASVIAEISGLLTAPSDANASRRSDIGDSGETRRVALRRKDGCSIPAKIHLKRAFCNGEDHLIASLHELRNIVELENCLRDTEDRFDALTHLSVDWYWEQDQELRFTYFSGTQHQRRGVNVDSMLGKTRFELPNACETEEIRVKHERDLAARRPFRDLVLTHKSAAGQTQYVSVSGEPRFDGNGEFAGYRGIAKDITAARLTDNRLSRLRDYYAMLSESNNAIMRAANAQTLFENVCRIAVERGRLRSAWVGLLNETTRLIEPVSAAGTTGDLHGRVCTVRAPRSPYAEVIRTGAPHVSSDIFEEADCAFSPILKDAGVRAQAILPLRRGGNVAGALHLLSDEKAIFDPELVALLTRVADNLSFALDRFQGETLRRAAENALRVSEKRFRDIAEVAGEYVWENDLQARFTYLSPRVSDFLGYSVKELIGKSPSMIMPPGEIERVRKWLKENSEPDGTFRGLENRVIDKSGHLRWQRVSAVPMFDEEGKRIGHRGTAQDVTELKESETRINQLATRDTLTELPNRLMFHERLEQALDGAQRSGRSLAVLFVDLDRFKNINDSLGHHMGDLLLKEVAGRMGACIRSGDTLARLGGDEFVIALTHLRQPEDATLIATKIIQSLSDRIEIAGQSLNTSCSLGISLFPTDGRDVETLLRNADTAMYHAKERGRNKFQFFSPEMNVRAVKRHHIEVALRKAIDRQEFELLYQPQTTVGTDTLVGAEALIRWHHPERGLIAPVEFIQVAEESGLIEPLGRWVLRQACVQAKQWELDGHLPIKIAVNISARQLIEPNAFLADVTRVLAETRVDPRQIELEMTESLFLSNVDDNAAMLRKLGQLGIRIAVDDFGTGYSSLAYLKRLPIDSLKIDRTFVRDVETDSEDTEIIRAIIAMAHGLRLKVTAEGVETTGQLNALRELGCDEYQGYLLSRPIEAAAFSDRFLQADHHLDTAH